MEIDLLRSGKSVIAVPPESIPINDQSIYRACVWRAARPDAYDYYPITLQQRLPRIRIPLRKGEKDVVLDLQALLDQSYRNGGYDDINYTRDLVPSLAKEDDAWTYELLKSRGLRT